FDAVAFGIDDPSKLAEFGFLGLGIDFDAFCAKLGQQPLKVFNSKVDHERFLARLEIFRVIGKNRPHRRTVGVLRIIPPLKSEAAPALGFDSQMFAIPFAQLVRIFGLEENSADTCDSFHQSSSCRGSPRGYESLRGQGRAPTSILAARAGCIAAPSVCASS